MNILSRLVVVSSCLLAAAPALAKVAGVTADGTWDCADTAGAGIGTVVIANASYAFILPDGKVTPYGSLKTYGLAEQDLPAFVILDGYLKDEMAAVGLTMTGPPGNEHDLSGEHFLKLVISETDLKFCTRRKAP
jgi:hypothetical protein